MREIEGEKSAVTFKIHRGEVLPSGMSGALQPGGNIMQFHRSLTMSREALSLSFQVLTAAERVRRGLTVTNTYTEHKGTIQSVRNK